MDERVQIPFSSGQDLLPDSGKRPEGRGTEVQLYFYILIIYDIVLDNIY